jgi:hypothetical protein
VSRRAIRLALRLYPRPWRDAHRDELEQLTDDLLDDPRERPWSVAASTVLGALRERTRPKYLTGTHLMPLGLAGAAMVVAGIGVAHLVGQSPGVDLIPMTAQSTGRLATLTGMEAVLDTQRVRVTVNGVAVPLPEIAGRSVGFEGTAAAHMERTVQPVVLPIATPGPQSFIAPVFRFSPLVAVKRAIAYQVLVVLAARQAKLDGHVVTLSAARAFAQHEYAVWRLHPVPLPHGEGAAVFLNADAVAGYRQTLTINKELTVIAGPQGWNRTPGLERWMAGQLIKNSVVIVGVPGLDSANLPASLPPNL